MEIRTVNGSDYYIISPIINDWWGGRNMADMLPKLFFDHFQDTSFIVEKDGEIVGFLIGFLSQTYQNEAYIHFVGVHPDYRKLRIGQKLYQHFFNIVQSKGRNIVRCVTSPVNKGSMAYHTKMGFDIVEGDKTIDDVWVSSDYDGLAQDRVLFIKYLN